MTGQRSMSCALIPGHPSLSASLTLDLLPAAGPVCLLRPLDSAMSNRAERTGAGSRLRKSSRRIGSEEGMSKSWCKWRRNSEGLRSPNCSECRAL
ncbi:hypothetical protein M514_07804 [Trichuris suis]|uniref:Uncharacterized protein n=1 Tax=Trichuris suis TaxID=68888 RepID=A0A085MUH8_9BILA|nr:hypothetical protein M513_07804 [Trichuris suis]KFD60874.1 hypothetical protein M514_07804 [Trichuris suis]